MENAKLARLRKRRSAAEHTFGRVLTHKITLPFDDLALRSISYFPHETADLFCAGAISGEKPRPNGLTSEQLPLESV